MGGFLILYLSICQSSLLESLKDSGSFLRESPLSTRTDITGSARLKERVWMLISKRAFPLQARNTVFGQGAEARWASLSSVSRFFAKSDHSQPRLLASRCLRCNSSMAMTNQPSLLSLISQGPSFTVDNLPRRSRMSPSECLTPGPRVRSTRWALVKSVLTFQPRPRSTLPEK